MSTLISKNLRNILNNIKNTSKLYKIIESSGGEIVINNIAYKIKRVKL